MCDVWREEEGKEEERECVQCVAYVGGLVPTSTDRCVGQAVRAAGGRNGHKAGAQLWAVGRQKCP
eukprot:scaffold674_cov63-Cyclotella_meneghiniana.AAC.6